MRRLAAGVVLLLLMSAVPAMAQITQDDLEDARDRIRELSADLDVKAAEYESATNEQEALSAELDRLVIELAVKERELAEAKVSAREVVLEMYMTGTTEVGITSIFEASTFNEIPTRAGYLESLASADQAVINHLSAISKAFMEKQAQMEEAVVLQQELTIRLTRLAQTIETELAAADVEYRTLRAEWQAQEEERIRREEEARRRAAEEERRRAEEFAATSTTTTTRPPTTTRAPTTTTTTRPPSSTTTTTTSPPDTSTTTTTTSPGTRPRPLRRRPGTRPRQRLSRLARGVRRPRPPRRRPRPRLCPRHHRRRHKTDAIALSTDRTRSQTHGRAPQRR